MPPPKNPTRYKLHILRLSESHKGKVSPLKGKRTGRIPKSAFQKGHIPWCKGTKGLVSGYWAGKRNEAASKRMSSNPLMDNKEIVEKMRTTKRKLYAEGKIVSWNKGLPPEQQPGYGRSCPKRAETMKRLRQDPEFIAAMVESFNKKPTRLERKMQDILNKYFQGQFAYNGNCDLGIVIGSLVPDFVNINGEKLLIEVFGHYWHTRTDIAWSRTEAGRKVIYYKLGYKCAIIWEHELRDEKGVVDKIRMLYSTYHDDADVERKRESRAGGIRVWPSSPDVIKVSGEIVWPSNQVIKTWESILTPKGRKSEE